jgi:NAD+ diphosphatase
MPSDFVASISPPDSKSTESWWFIFSGYRLLVLNATSGGKTIPRLQNPEALGISIERKLWLGTLQGIPCYAAEGSIRQAPSSEYSFAELRSLFGELEAGLYDLSLLGVHLVAWDKSCQFCSKCRSELKECKDVRAKECIECGRLEFPRISPAIIVLIQKGDSLLLARSPRFPGEFFSVLAGFVEPGESLEEAVHREVMEEAGIAVKNIKYFGSQPWPFPDSLMIGFTAEYESGEIKIDGDEIIDARWFQADNLPNLPGKLSIARALIDRFVEQSRMTIDE